MRNIADREVHCLYAGHRVKNSIYGGFQKKENRKKCGQPTI